MSGGYSLDSSATELANITYHVSNNHMISGLEFFLSALDNSSNAFHLAMVRVKACLEWKNPNDGLIYGQRLYDFILECFLFLSGRGVIVNMMANFNNSWFRNEIVPDLLIPFTSYGDRLIEHIFVNGARYFDEKSGPLKLSSYAQHESDKHKVWLEESLRHIKR